MIAPLIVTYQYQPYAVCNTYSVVFTPYRGEATARHRIIPRNIIDPVGGYRVMLNGKLYVPH